MSLESPRCLSEEEFLLACLRASLNSESLADVRDLAATGRLDWAQLGARAVSERIAPLVYDAVAGQNIVPGTVEALWRGERHRAVALNAFLRRELSRALQALRAAEIPVIVMKGAALCATVYGWAGPRPMSDLDLLVSPADRERAVGVLTHLGYGRLREEPRLGVTFDFENAVALGRPRGEAGALDLHWSLFDSPHFQHHVELGWFWQTATAVPLDGGWLHVFAPEAQLLHLCGHLVLHHRAVGLLWRHDVAAFLGQYGAQLDWPTTLLQASAHSLALPLRGVLGGVALDWRLQLPDGVLADLQALEPSADEQRLYAHFTADRTAVGHRFVRDLCALSTWRERWLFAKSHLLPTPAYMRQRYGVRRSLWLPLLYVYRWWLGLRSLLR